MSNARLNNGLVRARAPLRLGLAGGGTDVSPYCDEFGGAVLNATIDLFAYTTLQPRSDGRVRFLATDLDREEELAAAGELPLEGDLRLHRGVYNRIMRDFNDGQPLGLDVITHVDTPAGSGLGSSSTLVVAMVEAYRELLRLPLGEYDVAHLAYEIERRDVGLNGGRQDQYAATFGGINFMEFRDDDHVIVNPLRINDSILNELEASLVLYFTGVSRESATIIDAQTRAVESHDQRSIEGMHQLKRDAVGMKEALLRGEIVKLAGILGHSWTAKKQTAAQVSNAEIDRVYERAVRAGALSGKVSGAGGGGFMMFVVDPARRMDVLRALGQEPGSLMACHFTSRGSEAWRVRR